ncbi:hypothetical protein RHMOL_Rhmol07G0163500 [Rhododendron molle]|uniref:Uncharacterized protein n=1 Tax=Rhododendron molle TaxID=49168 RepID=A0ACC0N1H6_RHOML|nr:hypothetical protein RHMOL_Rhmol07G0163500 [Rhododendron molle]
MHGFFCYWTPTIKRLIGEPSQPESEKEYKLKSILQRLVGRFCEHHNKWRLCFFNCRPFFNMYTILCTNYFEKYMNSLSSLQGGTGLCVAELDVLISLAIVCNYYEGPTCRHFILGLPCPDEVPCLSAKSLGHPVRRSDSLGKSTFVPNDVTIGGFGHASFILLTGPNMGGKSTLLRQVWWAVI